MDGVMAGNCTLARGLDSFVSYLLCPCDDFPQRTSTMRLIATLPHTISQVATPSLRGRPGTHLWSRRDLALQEHLKEQLQNLVSARLEISLPLLLIYMNYDSILPDLC